MATIEISEQDLLRLLSENSHLHKQVTELQTYNNELLMGNRELKREVLKLQEGIRKHRDASGHDLCWYVPELWDLLPDKMDSRPQIPPMDEFLHCCRQYRESLNNKTQE
jgi:hypothetical protein